MGAGLSLDSQLLDCQLDGGRFRPIVKAPGRGRRAAWPGMAESASSAGAIRRVIRQVDEAVDSALLPVVRTMREGVTAVYSQALVSGGSVCCDLLFLLGTIDHIYVPPEFAYQAVCCIL